MNINIVKAFDRRVGFLAVAAILVAAVLLPTVVAAAQLTGRSIGLSSSSVSATNVSYNVNFVPASNAGAFIVDFCSNTPLVGEDCDTPAGFSATLAASTTVGFTGVSALDSNTVRVTGSMTASTPVSVAITGITNPSVAGPLYVRIVTFNTETNANGYDSVTVGAGNIDRGGAAVSITNTIGVSGAVLESMTFCVSAVDIGEECDGIQPPVLVLGEEVSEDVTALSSGAVSEGSIYTQISTNAVNGAVISLKSNTAGCGGLLRAGAPGACDIIPAPAGEAPTGSITAGQARFGVKTTAATNAGNGDNSNGTLQVVSTSIYNPSTFTLNYVEEDETGITSVFGDPFLDTNNAPVNNKNMELIFGASMANNTPAGMYSADISLVATGKF